jgi:hypothetical protein
MPGGWQPSWKINLIANTPDLRAGLSQNFNHTCMYVHLLSKFHGVPFGTTPDMELEWCQN